MTLNRTPWTADTIMPWGEHEGTKLDDVPASYLLWLLQQRWLVDWPGLHAYIKANEDVLREQHGGDEDAKGEVEGYATYEDYLKEYRGY